MEAEQWFLAQVKPNSAQIAKKNLDIQNFRTFLPLEEKTRLSYGKMITSASPLFPGYLFVALDTANGQWRQVNSTFGVSRILSIGKSPAAVPTQLVNQLMQRCDESGLLLPPKVLEPSDSVIITRGPFANFAAEVEKMAADSRVWVLMDLMGAKTRVAVPADQLRVV